MSVQVTFHPNGNVASLSAPSVPIAKGIYEWATNKLARSYAFIKDEVERWQKSAALFKTSNPEQLFDAGHDLRAKMRELKDQLAQQAETIGALQRAADAAADAKAAAEEAALPLA